eukprot:376787-Rhodomonas_salina.2
MSPQEFDSAVQLSVECTQCKLQCADALTFLPLLLIFVLSSTTSLGAVQSFERICVTDTVASRAAFRAE